MSNETSRARAEAEPDTMIQLLTPDGELLPAGPYASYIDRLTSEDLRDMYRQMVLARRFDAEATALQRQGELGLWVPCVGQEGAQVGAGKATKTQDFVFPGYRDHALVMTRGVDPLDILPHVRGTSHGGWDPREHNCHIYTLVVGSQTLHATGYAIGMRKDGACATGNPDTDQAVLVCLGDGATSEGDVSESLVFAAANRAPIVFFCQNNQWAISEPTSRQTPAPLYRRGEGFGVPGWRVDGNDVLACYAVTAAALDEARSGAGPRFIEAFTYRIGAHTTSDDPGRYRDQAETDAWAARDPISRWRRYLERETIADQEFFDQVEAAANDLSARARQTVRTLEALPLDHYFDLAYATPHPLVSEEKAWWAEYKASFADAAETSPVPSAAAAPSVHVASHTAPAEVPMTANRAGSSPHITAVPAPAAPARQLTLAKAINLGLRDGLAENPRALIMGEDVGRLGGVFRVTDGLFDEFGEERVTDTPLAESGIVGTAIGLALRGYRPVCEIQFDGFVFPAFDQITTQLAKMHSRSGGLLELPVVIRIPYGGGIGAVEQHSESPEAMFAHTAGLRVVTPASPQDGYTMIRQAIASPDPVLFLEPKARYWDKAEVLTGGPIGDPAELHQARTIRPGRDATIVAYGPSVHTALAAAAIAEGEGHSIEVLDLRSISPIDFDSIEASVRRTKHLVVVHEAPVFFGAGAEIAARIEQRCFYELEAPVLRVGGFHLPYPPAKVEQAFLPDADRVLDAVDRALAY